MKQRIRENYLKIRKKKYFELSKKNKIFIVKQIRKLCNKYKINKLALYYPINYELNILSVTTDFKIKKLQTCLPVIERNNNMTFKEWKTEEPFHINRIGILEPNNRNKKIKPQMILVPLVAYDKFKNRLGYGKGFYDKALKNISSDKLVTMLPKKNISSFSFAQIHDIKIGNVFTETEENYNGYN